MASDTSVLVGEAMAALERRDGRAALAKLEQARAQTPEDPNILMTIALARQVVAEDGAHACSPEPLDTYASRRRDYAAGPIGFHQPHLPSITFFGREHFDWLPELESATDMIRGEYEAAAPTAPLAPSAEINTPRPWRSFPLGRHGAQQQAGCARCPGTAELLSRLPLADPPGGAPNAIFSVLDARAHVPARTGSTNARLLVQLPLVLPGPARLRVGNHIREWTMGEAWAFDPAIEHEAWNDADSPLVILVFQVWNPLLSRAERELVGEVMQGGGPADLSS